MLFNKLKEKNIPKYIFINTIIVSSLYFILTSYSFIQMERNNLNIELKEYRNTLLKTEDIAKVKKLINEKKIKLEQRINDKIFYATIYIIIFILVGTVITYWFTSDITEIIDRYKQKVKHKKMELIDINKHLEEKVNEKTKELKNINEQLEQKVQVELSKNRQKEALLMQQSKMASVGEMISSIIHQWKQPLGIISVASSGMKLQIEMDDINKDEFIESTQNISEQIKHMTQTMDDFQNFFKQTPKKEYVVSDIARDAVILVNDIFKSKGIEINLKTEKEAVVYGYPNELIQVILNILNNARDIILEKNPDIYKIDIEIFQDDKNVFISIKDYAGGIPKDIIDKIFEPYFTTKPEDKGTGIGLYMSKTIIEKAKGTLSASNVETDIEGRLYHGAQFTINLPLKLKS